MFEEVSDYERIREKDWHLNRLPAAWEEAGVAGKTSCQVNHLDDDDFHHSETVFVLR